MDQNKIEVAPIVGSRVRLARNIQTYPFPRMLSEQESQSIINELAQIIDDNPYTGRNYSKYYLKETEPIKRQELVERHLMSPNLLKDYYKSALFLGSNKEISIMINEEDHIRIQCIKNGFVLNEALEEADKIDDILEENIKYAFSEKYGYLTSCISNLGTGIRASVMMHLPALRMTGGLRRIIQAIQRGFAVRGIFGEGSEALGNIFQISNQISLGVSEEEIVEGVKNVVMQIAEKELEARENLYARDKLLFEDKISRSLGLVSNARMLNYKESMSFLSDIILGVDMGIIEYGNEKLMDTLLNRISPATIQMSCPQMLTKRERDIKRAEIIRNTM